MLPVSDVIPARRTPVVTIGLIAATTMVFVYQLQLDSQQTYELARTYGVVPGELAIRQLVASLFLHDSWLHLVGNMLYLWLFGGTVEDAMGHASYLAFYLAAGVLAALFHAGLHPASAAPLIGASSAIGAVLAAYFVVFPTSKVLGVVFLIVYRDVVEIPALFFLPAWLVLQLLGELQTMGAQAADAVMAFAAQAVGITAGVIAGGVLRWRGRNWEMD